jgi:hypothetical protein
VDSPADSTAVEALSLGEMILSAMRDEALFGPHFSPGESWASWRVVLKALFALPMDESEHDLFRTCTGRSRGFDAPLTEALLLVGRRGGKSRILALIAAALACFRDYRPYLSPGERAVIMVLASDRDQSQVIFQYLRALLTLTPMLSRLIARETADEIELTNSVTVGVYTSSYRAVRGRTLAAVLADEICFWQSETSRDPASAVLAAVRPGLSTIPGSVLLCASSVYSRSGVAYDMFARDWGRDAATTLIWKATTLQMRPTFNQQTIDKAYADDAASAASEYGSEFRIDISSFLTDADIEAAIDRGIRSRPLSLQYSYAAFCDMSGGRSDASTLGIGHLEQGGRIVLDRIEIVESPHNPENAVARFAEVLGSYALGRVIGDSYSGEWVPAAFARHSISYESADKAKSDIYLETLPLFSAGLLSLPDNPKLETELRQLERKTRPSGRDLIDHPKAGHDDAVNAALGCAWLVSRQSSSARDGSENSVTRAITDYDPNSRDQERARAVPPRHMHLLPINLQRQYEDTFSQATRDYDLFSR